MFNGKALVLAALAIAVLTFAPKAQAQVSVGIGIDQRSDAPKRKIKGLSDVKGILHQMLAPDYLDLSFTYMTSEYHVNFNQSKLFNSTNFTDIIYNPFAGLTCDMKTTSYIVSMKQTWLW